MDITSLRVMALDDDAFMLEVLQETLSQIGIRQVETCGDAEEMLEKVASDPTGVDVLFCDLLMPNMDGIEFISGLGATGYSGGVVILSGAEDVLVSMAEILANSSGIKLLGALRKPSTATEIEKILSQHSA